MPVRFVAYIDESGDTGLEAVKPRTVKGASEWLVLSCFLVREQDDHKCLGWVREVKSRFKNDQSPALHFSELLPVKKRIACEIVATKPCRYFIVASNKKNMEGYRNEAAEIVSGKLGTAWLYWWLTRLLLERVTDYCETRVRPEARGNCTLRITFSRRGGLLYRDFEYYLRKLRWQSILGTMELTQGDLCWSVIDSEEILVLDHAKRAGLQLADIGAGAFYQALEQNRPANCDPQFAKLLEPRIARDRTNRVLGYGIKSMPELHKMGLATEQREIFEFFGYNPKGW